MKLIPFVGFCLISCCCFSQKKNTVVEKEVELLKKYATIKCFDHAMSLFFVKDSLELSGGSIIEMMDANNMFAKNLEVLISDAKRAAEKCNPVTSDSAAVAEFTIGKNFYVIGCLDYYSSKSLDSLVRSIDRKKYVVDLNSIQPAKKH